ncbi:MAG: 23S rRNA (pseudouridine(1915)-N(3))-methyltransferase RlmH [Saprospiraceae bacterium]|nr:23S rRNA (pseudouridine(1915)-N(3))-methyltransferase RlmH [Saprospiraceae bacterium]
MKIFLWQIGKTSFKYLDQGVDLYVKRIKKYGNLSVETIPDVKNAGNFSPEVLKKKEGESILKKLSDDDFLILLDENGKSFSSVEFADYLQQHMNTGRRRIVFLIGGAFGFSEEVYQRSNFQVSLSKMTFSHQMIRLFFVEQVYRAFSILNNSPYHNE